MRRNSFLFITTLLPIVFVFVSPHPSGLRTAEVLQAVTSTTANDFDNPSHDSSDSVNHNHEKNDDSKTVPDHDINEERTTKPVLERTLKPNEERTTKPVLERTLKPNKERTIKPVLKRTLTPNEERTTKPVLKRTLKPNEERTTKPVLERTLKPNKERTTKPVLKRTLKPNEERTIKPVLKRTLKPNEERTTKPVLKRTLTPNKERTTKPVLKRTLKPNEERTTKPVLKRTLKPNEERTTKPVLKRTLKPNKERTTKPVLKRTLKPNEERTTKPVSKRTLTPNKERTTKPVLKRTLKPNEERTIKPVLKRTLTPNKERTTKPVLKRTLKPNVQVMSTSAPTMKNMTKPVAKKTTKPVSKRTLVPTMNKVVKPTKVYPSCLSKRPLRFSFNECSYEKLLQAVTGMIRKWRTCKNSPAKEMQLMFKAKNETDVMKIVNNVCLNAARQYSNTYLPFDKIANKGNNFEEDYFNGGSSWNEVKKRQVKTQTKAKTGSRKLAAMQSIIEVRVQGKRLGQIKKMSSRRGIKWPSSVTNFQNCALRAVTCCWVGAQQASTIEPRDNTDVCLVDFEKSSRSNHVMGGYALFPGDGSEGPVNCHGFAWERDPKKANYRLKGNTLFEIAMMDGFYKKGYVRNVPGAPMCGCVESMPVVSRADCTEVRAAETYQVMYNPVKTPSLVAILKKQIIGHQVCKGKDKDNDLASFYDRLVEEEEATVEERDELRNYIVGEGMCNKALEKFRWSKGVQCFHEDDV